MATLGEAACAVTKVDETVSLLVVAKHKINMAVAVDVSNDDRERGLRLAIHFRQRAGKLHVARIVLERAERDVVRLVVGRKDQVRHSVLVDVCHLNVGGHHARSHLDHNGLHTNKIVGSWVEIHLISEKGGDVGEG